MSVGDVIALVSLAFSLLTYVYSIALWPRLKILIDEDLWLYFFVDEQGDRLCLASYFTFFNSGAQPGAIANLLGTLSLVDRKGVYTRWDLRWNIFFEEDEVASTKAAHTFTVAGRASGGTKLIKMNLLTDHPCIIAPGKYALELRGLVGPRLTRWTVLRINFELSDKEAELLNHDAYKANGRDSDKTFLLTRRDTYKKEKLNMFMQMLRPGHLTFYHPGKELGES